MELNYPWVILIGIILITALILIKIKKDRNYKTGTKVANTQYVKKIPYYQRLLKKYKFMVWALKVLCILCICTAFILLARPYKTEITEEQKHSRDIMICMDVSTSVDELNMGIIYNMRNSIKDMDGERVGITIFNTTPVLLVPLTDDYDFISETLDKLYESIKLYNDSLGDYDIDNDFDIDAYLEEHELEEYRFSGTLYGNQSRGSSLISEGLAAAIYNFPDLDKDRTRILIFATDNDYAGYGEPLLTLKEATKIAQDKGIKIFAIAPEIISDKNETEMKKAVETSGGTYYQGSSENVVNDIMDNIEKQSKSLIESKTEERQVGKPTIPFIILLVFSIVLFGLSIKVKV